MDKQIRIPNESHDDLKKFADRKGISIRAAAAIAVAALSVEVVVAVNEDGSHDIVEVYTDDKVANARTAELIVSGFSGFDVSQSNRDVLSGLAELRKYGPAWKEAVGWTLGGSAGDA